MKLFFLAVRGPWTKIAMVIAEIADAMRTDLPSGDDGHEIISERIQVLVRAGRLAAQGTRTVGVPATSGDWTQERVVSMGDMGIFQHSYSIGFRINLR